ncbi:MFS transporter [Arcanobacterium buesumense]|uniref:MFS transporter n=1 Tax=Arcanobacterium buesumense TaxID=2722751 RepID=A0A6H2ELJ9_9ACTO|nr:MFS transporter [Arcanobacterium buesumense]QJC21943.1 MFS transporter [Arcanobacterium buesumense]
MNYKDIIFDREAGPLLLAINISRLAAGLVPFGLIAMYSSKHEYMFAGIASALLMAAGTLTAPYKGRVVMRFTPLRTIIPMSVGYCLCVGFGAFLSFIDKPFYVAVVFLLMGTLIAPPTPALVRTLWTRLALTDSHNRALHTLDSVSEELVFAITPLITTFFWSTVGAFWAIPVGLFCGFIGTTAIITLAGRNYTSTHNLISHPLSVGKSEGHEYQMHDVRSIYFNRITWGILGPMLGLGSAMGALSILLTKWSETILSEQSMAGVFLSIISFSGFFVGLLFGKVNAESISTQAQYRMASLAVAIGVIVITLGGNLFFVVIGSVILGSGMTIMFITSFMLIGAYYLEIRQTEMNAAIGASFDVGSGVANLSTGFLLSYFSLNLSLCLLSVVVILFTSMSFFIEAPAGYRR